MKSNEDNTNTETETMTQYRLITVPTGRSTLHDESCTLIDHRPHTSLETARTAAECMLSVLDFVYGASTHEVRIHRYTGHGAHTSTPDAVVTS